MTTNPYDSPMASCIPDARLTPTAPLRREVLFLVLAAFCFWVIGTLGGALLAHFCVAGQVFIGEEGAALMYWLRWGGKVVGRFCGDLTCGFLMGRYLQRIRPHYVLLVFVSLPLGIIAINRGFLDANDGLWLRSVGLVGCVIQLTLQLLMMAVIVFVGVRIGQQSLQAGGRPRRARNPTPMPRRQN
jgi:hypothetical protein